MKERKTESGKQKVELAGALRYEKGIGFCKYGEGICAHDIIGANQMITLGNPLENYSDVVQQRLIPYLKEKGIKSCAIFPLKTPSMECQPSSVKELESVERELSDNGLDAFLFKDGTLTIRWVTE